MGKQLHKYLIDLTIWSAMLPLAYLLRLEASVVPHIGEILLITLAAIPLKALVIYYLRFYRQSWHKVGVLDLFRLIEGVFYVMLVVLLVTFFARNWLFIPLSIPVIEATLTVLLLSTVRLAARMYSERMRRSVVSKSKRKVEKVLVAGAGEAGTLLAREIRRHPESYMEIVGFLDDNTMKHREWYLGYQIFGPLQMLPEVVEQHDIDTVVIAMPTAPGEVIRKVVEMCQQSGVKGQIMPGLYELLSGDFKISQIRDVNLADLLRRKQVELDLKPISEYLYERTVLVTGAGGSIGSEIVRQITRFGPSRVILLGRGENSIYKIESEFRARYPAIEAIPVIADVRDRASLEHQFRTYRPEVVFHAAAHKHVPLMECNPEQAILNNVGGTRNLVELALEYDVQRFVNISSDKSVNPTSVMGSSKRVAEYVVQWAAGRSKEHQAFVSVRFGNVLGSRGSVVPLFKRQIENGGPITVTHPDMTRYFMTIPEASQLVLQAGGLGDNGSVYVLDMGQPVRIVDLARDLITLSGYKPEIDIDIVYSGIRPGEKLFEELLTAEEGTTATRHTKIFSARTKPLSEDVFEDKLKALFDKAHARDEQGIRHMLQEIIPTYSFQEAKTQGDLHRAAVSSVQVS